MAAPPSRPRPRKDSVGAKDVVLFLVVFGGIGLFVVAKLRSCGAEAPAAAAAPAAKAPPVREPADAREAAVRRSTDEIRQKGYTAMFPAKDRDEETEGVSRLLIDNLGTWSMRFLLDGEEIFEVKVLHQSSAEIELRSGAYDLLIVSDRSDVPPAGGRVTLSGVHHLALQVQGDDRLDSAVHTCTGEHPRVRSLPR